MTPLNKAPAPNRRPRFPFAALGEFEYPVCAPPPLPAAVGEARRSAQGGASLTFNDFL